ncbi:MAG: serine/threonine-protein kinase [Myxococcota bacterium]
MTLSRGTPLGSLTIEEKLASGERGETYLARQPALDRWVVVRKLPADMMGGGGGEAFVREGRLAARVVHPNVLAVLDCFALRGEYYRVEERVEGEDLETLLAAKGHVPRRVALAIVLEVARGIRALHERHIVHCGLDPSRVIIGRWGEVKLIGLCDARDLDAEVAPAGIADSPYAAPEAVAGVGVDARADLYSLGSLAQALVTGSPLGRRTAIGALRGCRSETPGDRPTIREAIHRLEARVRNAAPEACRSEIAAYLWEARRSQPRPTALDAVAPDAVRDPVRERPAPGFWSRERLSRLHLPASAQGSGLERPPVGSLGSCTAPGGGPCVFRCRPCARRGPWGSCSPASWRGGRSSSRRAARQVRSFERARSPRCCRAALPQPSPPRAGPAASPSWSTPGPRSRSMAAAPS